MKIIPKIIPKLGPKVYDKYSFNLSDTLPRTGLIWYARDGVDTIGLSANALWDALPSYMRYHYLSDRDTKLPDATIIANIQASGFLNVGGGLHGNATKGYAQYQDGTSTDILDKAARYYKETYGWPTDIKSLVIASGGDIDSPIGPSVSYSAAAGQVLVNPWTVQNSSLVPVGDSGYNALPALVNILTASPASGASTKSLTAQPYCLQAKTGSVSCSYGTATPSSPLQFTPSAGNVTFTPTDCDDWCLTATSFIPCPLPYNQSSVSTNATSAGIGLSMTLSTAVSNLLGGSTMTLLMVTRAVLSSDNMPVGFYNLFSYTDVVDSFALRNDAGTKYINRFRGVQQAATWSRLGWLIRVFEAGGGKCRAGYQKYDSDGVAIDADIVWSHATLAGGAAYSTLSPTAPLRFFFNSALAFHFRSWQASDITGLSNTELIRRARKYGQF